MGDAEPPEAHGAAPGGYVAAERERGDAFEALREDFRFNLRLLRERDAHIDNLEAELARLRAALASADELDASDALEASRARDEAGRALDAKHASSLRDALAAVEAAQAEAADASNQVKGWVVRTEDARLLHDLEGMERGFNRLQEVNRDLLMEHSKRTTNHENLLGGLKKVIRRQR